MTQATPDGAREMSNACRKAGLALLFWFGACHAGHVQQRSMNSILPRSLMEPVASC